MGAEPWCDMWRGHAALLCVHCLTGCLPLVRGSSGRWRCCLSCWPASTTTGVVESQVDGSLRVVTHQTIHSGPQGVVTISECVHPPCCAIEVASADCCPHRGNRYPSYPFQKQVTRVDVAGNTISNYEVWAHVRTASRLWCRPGLRHFALTSAIARLRRTCQATCSIVHALPNM